MISSFSFSEADLDVLDDDQFDQLADLYSYNPIAFDFDSVTAMENRAKLLGRAFRRNEEADAQGIIGKVGSILGQVGGGFAEGFTTLRFGDDPEGVLEEIARSVGSVLGLVGYVPGWGAAGKLAVTMGARTLLGRGLKTAAGLWHGAGAAARGNSIPFMVANKVIQRAERGAVLGSLLKAGRAGDLVRGGLELGIATGVQNWQGGVDAMLSGFSKGALEGVVFRGINNYADFSKLFGATTKESAEITNRIARGIASSAYSGLPATLAQEPLPVQVYEYLLGAYFGGMEPSYEARKAGEFISREIVRPSQDAGKGGRERIQTLHDRLLNYGDLPGYKDQEEGVREEITTQIGEMYGRRLKVGEREVWGPELLQLLAVRDEILERGGGDEEAFREMGKKYRERLAAEEEARKEAAERLERIASEGLPTTTPEAPRAAEGTEEAPAGTSVESGPSTIEELLREPVRREPSRRVDDVDHAFGELLGDHRIPARMARPLMDVAEALIKDRVVSEDGTESYGAQDVVRSVATRFSSARDKGEAGWQEALDGIKEDLNLSALDESSEPVRLLRQAWKRSEADQNKSLVSIVVGQGEDGSPKFFSRDLEREDYAGNRVEERIAPSLLDRVLDRIGLKRYSIKTVEKPAGKDKWETANLFDEDVPWHAVVQRMDAQGRPVFAAVKDKGELTGTDRHVFEAAPVRIVMEDGEVYARPIAVEEAPRAAAAKRASIERTLSRYGKGGTDEAYGKLLARFREEGGFEGMTDADVAALYDRQWLSTVTLIEELNGGLPFETMLEANLSGKGKFVLDVAGLNKRMQVFADGSVTATPERLREVEGVVADDGTNDHSEGVRFAIVNAVRKGANKEHAKGVSAMMLQRVGKDGKTVEEYAGEHHLDGVFFLRSDLYDALARDAGLDPEAATAKGVVIYDSEIANRGERKGQNLGAMMGKFAYFRADEAVDRALREAPRPLHALMYDTAAKQRGFRKSYDAQVQEDGSYHFYTAGSDNPNPFGRALIKKAELTEEDRVTIESSGPYLTGADYRSPSGAEIPEKTADTVFHGTRAESVEVDDEGNLVLRPSKNFSGKQEGISFTELSTVAREYGERRGGKRRSAIGTVVIEVERGALGHLSRESAEEVMLRTGKPVVVPKGRFTVYRPELHGAEKEFSVWEAEMREEADRGTLGDAVDLVVRSSVEKEIAENALLAEEQRSTADDPVNQMIVEKYGHVNPILEAQSRFAVERLRREAERLGGVDGLRGELARMDAEMQAGYSEGGLDPRTDAPVNMGPYGGSAWYAEAFDYLDIGGMVKRSATRDEAPRSDLSRVGELESRKPQTEFESYTIPLDGIRLNIGASEDTRHALHDQHMPRQQGTNLTDPAAISRYMDLYVRPSFYGDPEANTRAEEFLASRDERLIEGLDVEDMGVREILRAITRPGEMLHGDALWQKVWKHILKKDREKDDDGDYSEMLEEAFQAEKTADASRRILDIAVEEGILSPVILHNPKFLEGYALSALRNYLVGRVLRPRVKYSGVAILQPQDPHFQLRLKAEGDREGVRGGHLQAGYFMLGDAWRAKKVRWLNGTETTLEEAYRQYGEAGGQEKEQMAALLEHTIIRVPADSLSGSRILKFAGFTGRKGAGMTLHNEDMIHIGGADLDIDKAFIIQDIDRAEPSRLRTETFAGNWSPYDVRSRKDAVFVFGDNDMRTGRGGQAVIRDEPNALGIRTKKKPSTSADSYYTDAEYESNVAKIDEDVSRIREAIRGGKTIVLAEGGYGTGLAKLKEKAPRTFAYLQKILEEIGSTGSRPRISLEASQKKSPYFAKDQAKAARASKFIGRGSASSSTEAYRLAVGAAANTGQYDAGDVVFVSAEGARSGRIAPDFAELGRAADAGVTFVTDAPQDRQRSYNVGEREVAGFLESRGYRDDGAGTWTREDRPIRDHILSAKDQWYDKRFPGSKVIIDAKEDEDLFVRKLEDFEEHPVATGDARLLYGAGQGARRGNKTLGVFATAGRRGQVIHQLLGGEEAWLKPSERAMERIQGEVSEKLQEGEQLWGVKVRVQKDRTAFDRIRRAGMNFAADAGNYAGLKMDADRAGAVLARALTSKPVAVIRKVTVGKDGQEKVSWREVKLESYEHKLTDIPLGRQMSRVDRHANGRRGDDGRVPTIWDSLEGFGEFFQRTRQEGTLPNAWYEGLQMLGDMAYRPVGRELQVKPWGGFEQLPAGETLLGRLLPTVGGKFEQFKEQVKELSVLAKQGDRLAREVLSTISRRAVNPVSERILRDEKGFPLTKDGEVVRLKKEYEEADLAYQDLADVVSVIHLYRKGKSVVASHAADGSEQSIARLRELAESADNFKGLAIAARKGQMKGSPKDTATPGTQLEAVKRRIAEYRDNLTASEQEYFDAYMLGSLSPQPDMESKTWMRKKEAAFVETQLAEGKTKKEALALWKNGPREEAMRAYWRTNQGRLGFELESVSDQSVADYLRAWNEVAQASFKPELNGAEQARAKALADPENSPIIAAVTGDPANGEIRTFELERFGQRFMQDVFDFDVAKEEVMGQLSKKERAEFERMYGDLRALFKLYPQILDFYREGFRDYRYESVFEGVTARRGLGVSPSKASYQDVKDFLYAMGQVRRGDLQSVLALKHDDERKRFRQIAHVFFPEWTAKYLEPFDLKVSKTVVRPVMTREGVVDKEVREVFSTFSRLHEFAVMTQEQGSKMTERLQAERKELFRDLEAAAGQDWQDLYEVSVALRQWKLGEKMKGKNPYSDELNSRKETRERLKGKTYLVPQAKGKPRQVTGEELMGSVEAPGLINQRLTARLEEAYGRFIRNAEAEKRYFVPGEDGVVDPYRTLEKMHEELRQTGELPWVGIEGGLRVAHERFLREQVELSFSWLRNTVNEMRRDERMTDEDYKANMNRLGRLIQEGQTSGKLEDLYRGGKITKGLYYEKLSDLRKQYPFQETGRFPSDLYYPQNGHDQKVMRDYFASLAKKLEQEDASTIQKAKLDKLKWAAAQGYLPDLGMSDWLRDYVLRPMEVPELRDKKSAFAAPSMRPRTDSPVPGWDHSPAALDRYESQLARAYFQTMNALTGQMLVRDFRKREPMGSHTEAWAKFGDLLVQSTLGGPSIYPRSWVDEQSAEYDREFNFRKSASWYVSDHHALERMKKADRLLGTEYTKDMTPTNALGRQRARQLAHFAQLEGKWQMMTLLASTRGMTNNLVGGSLQTVVSAGFSPWLRAGNLSELRKVFPGWKGWDDARRFAEEAGAIESYIAGETGIPDVLKTGAGKKAWGEIAKVMQEDPFAIGKVKEIARRHGVFDTLFKGSAWFMQTVERSLRMRAFYAHYLKAREAFEASGAVFEADHPHLLAMARKGVQATQFLYDNAARPAFARTNLGRMLTRFQLWSWNSVRFQRDIYREARNHGFTPGTESFDRFRRLAQIDLFVFALASVFPSSLFDNVLPAPWNYVQESALFLFGDEEDKERAFFGTLPYPFSPAQVVSPPVIRMPMAVFGSMLSGDWDRFTSYHLWSWFPFGMAARNVYRTYDNPSMVIENMTGFPLHRVHREVTQDRE